MQSTLIADCPMQTKPYQAEELQHRVSHETVIRCDEPLAKRTTLRVGGPADLYLEPASDADLVAILNFCVEKKMPFFVLGRGSNLLVKDRGFRGAAISLAHQAFSGIEFEGQRLRCGAGAKLKTVSVEAKRHDLTGLEFLEGIPGTIGGALRMNAGAMGSAIFDFVESVRLIDFHGNMFERTRKELDVSYRQCSSLRTHIALGAILHCQPAPRELIERRMKEFSQKRWTSQPAAPSAGCIFKNPASIPAGKLVDELGLKGTRVGGAFVSAEHGNFIVNDGTATAQNVLDLIEIIRQHARKGRSIDLQTEVEIIGE
jgi:UDP-N-acetylenolpyruvoylglucosamine reductase